MPLWLAIPITHPWAPIQLSKHPSHWVNRGDREGKGYGGRKTSMNRPRCAGTGSGINFFRLAPTSTEEPWRTNQMPAICAVSCNCQMFQVNFIPSIAPNLKTAVWFFALCSKRSFLSHSVKTIDRRLTDHQVARTRLQPCSISCSSPLNRLQYVRYGKPLKKTGLRSFALIVAL